MGRNFVRAESAWAGTTARTRMSEKVLYFRSGCGGTSKLARQPQECGIEYRRQDADAARHQRSVLGSAASVPPGEPGRRCARHGALWARSRFLPVFATYK